MASDTPDLEALKQALAEAKEVHRDAARAILEVAAVSLGVLAFGATEGLREGVLMAAANTSDLQLISIHILRIAAIGTLVKYVQGEFPLHFIVLGAMPDFVFAVSAIVLAIWSAGGPLPQELLIAWHATGFLLFFGAGLTMFFSVPSPLRITRAKPDTSIAFRYPMALAPNFTVPLFMLAHLFALTKLFWAP